jgi:hypothetical protein
VRTRLLLGAIGVAWLVLLSSAVAPATAKKQGAPFKCDGVFTGVTIKHVVVPRDGACTLTHSTVKGKVRVLKNAYFQATDTSIRKKVVAKRAQTLFIDTDSRVGGGIQASKTIQVFVFNSTVAGDIDVRRASDRVQICGTTVRKGGIDVRRSRTDMLIGDPLAVGCPGNTVKRGDVRIQDNFTDVELVIRGNKITKGNLEVFDNTGPSDKFVQDNTGGRILRCADNRSPFTASANAGWQDEEGQCAGA